MMATQIWQPLEVAVYFDKELTKPIVDGVSVIHHGYTPTSIYVGFRDLHQHVRAVEEYITFSIQGLVLGQVKEIRGGLDNVVELSIPYHKEFKQTLELIVSQYYY